MELTDVYLFCFLIVSILFIRLYYVFTKCVMTLGSTTDETAEYPRIAPITFERWYKVFYNVYDDEDDAIDRSQLNIKKVDMSSAS
jgi:hypothetical protein